MSEEHIKNMVDAVKNGNVNEFQKNFSRQTMENVGKGIEARKETIASSMFKESKNENVSISFKSTSDAGKFTKEASKAGIKNISVTMKNVSFETKDEEALLKIMPLVDKYNGEIK